jgi:hypothetical protein
LPLDKKEIFKKGKNILGSPDIEYVFFVMEVLFLAVYNQWNSLLIPIYPITTNLDKRFNLDFIKSCRPISLHFKSLDYLATINHVLILAFTTF